MGVLETSWNGDGMELWNSGQHPTLVKKHGYSYPLPWFWRHVWTMASELFSLTSLVLDDIYKYVYIYTHLHLLYTVQYTTKRQQYGSLTTKLSPTICLQIALFVAIRFMPQNHEKKTLEIFPFSQLTNSSRLQTSPKKLANQTSAPSSHRCVFSATKKHLLDFLAPHKVIVSLKHTSPPR